jgi:hypothetical protein
MGFSQEYYWLFKIGRTPAMLAKDNSVRSEINMTMNGDGSITGKTVAKMTGSLEIESRSIRYGDDHAGEEKDTNWDNEYYDYYNY